MGRCPDAITDNDLLTHWASLGPDAIKKISWAEKDGNFKGFGFVLFNSPSLAEKASLFEPPTIAGRQILVSYKKSGTSNTPKRSVSCAAQVHRQTCPHMPAHPRWPALLTFTYRPPPKFHALGMTGCDSCQRRQGSGSNGGRGLQSWAAGQTFHFHGQPPPPKGWSYPF